MGRSAACWHLQMPHSASSNAADSRLSESNSQADRGLTFREVNELLGLHCRTSHTARAYAAQGKIRSIRINERVIRFSENSVRALLAGGAA